ncbi:MAG: DNA/RNA non-specific endonuclease [Bacteroidia bacterium]
MNAMRKVLVYIIFVWIAQLGAQQNLCLPSVSAKEKITKHRAYYTSYSHSMGQPLWVAYELHRTRLIKVAKRAGRFKTDPLISPKTVSHDDYTHSGFDRGHLAPAADMAWSSVTMKESFYTSNICPQIPGFNRGIWKNLESLIRNWASDESHLFIVTGPIFKNDATQIGKTSKISVPSHFFKAVLDTAGEDKCLAFVIPNYKSKSPIESYAVSVDQLEEMLGRDLFPALDDEVESRIESAYRFEDWD